jgi:hypothetical protein
MSAMARRRKFELIKPRAIVALGATALYASLGSHLRPVLCGRISAPGSCLQRHVFLLLSTRAAITEPVSVRYSEGLGHGFLSLRTLDGSLR